MSLRRMPPTWLPGRRPSSSTTTGHCRWGLCWQWGCRRCASGATCTGGCHKRSATGCGCLPPREWGWLSLTHQHQRHAVRAQHSQQHPPTSTLSVGGILWSCSVRPPSLTHILDMPVSTQMCQSRMLPSMLDPMCQHTNTHVFYMYSPLQLQRARGVYRRRADGLV